ncbi:Shedu immune nuclease family protein [Enterococcus faecalis]|uniref:Shedu immune nuclease family protein n=1 Tax=Enterococcus faecalis TaxID=1351 RepID=UPI00115E999C|nr:Shedu immune nuclease family protein [Enterococcus faecalis]
MSSLEFIKRSQDLVCQFWPQELGLKYVASNIHKYGEAYIKRVFKVTKEDILPVHDDFDDVNWDEDLLELILNESIESIEFVIGNLIGEYYLLKNDIFDFEQKFYLHKDLKITHKTFLANRNISVLNRIDTLIDDDIYIGGNHDNAIPASEFQKLLKSFPTTTEMFKYANKRVGAILENYVELKRDYVGEYDKYMNSRLNHPFSLENKKMEIEIFENEYLKYLYIKEKLEKMLSEEEQFSEKDWQDEIAKIVTLIFPKYYTFVDEVTITTDEGNKRPDFIFVDTQGHIDVVEIKKSHNIPIISKSEYRKNYTPSKELTGTIMQTEKYLYHLNRTTINSENKIKAKLLEKKGIDMDIKIRNPQGVLILGRSNELNENQIRDYEIIKRKYKNMIDVISYDDLINRLDMLLKHFQFEVLQ